MNDTKEPERSTARDNGLAPGWMMVTEKRGGDTDSRLHARVYLWAPSVASLGSTVRVDDSAVEVVEEPEELQRRHVAAMLRWERAKRQDQDEEADRALDVRDVAGADADAPEGTLQHLAFSLSLACVSWGLPPAVAVDYARNLAQAVDGEITPAEVLESINARREAFRSDWACIDDGIALELAQQLHVAMVRHAVKVSRLSKGGA